MEEWVVKVILGYIVYMVFILLVTAGTNIRIYELTAEQQAALTSSDTDVFVLLNKLFILSSVNAVFATASIIGAILTIIFIIALAVAINEFIPFT